jgi:hypothetical protein
VPSPARPHPTGTTPQPTAPSPGAPTEEATTTDPTPTTSPTRTPQGSCRPRAIAGAGRRRARPGPYLRRVAAAALVCAVLLVAAASPASAAGGGTQSLQGLISNLTTWLVGILAGVATLFLTIGGLRYLTAGGDPGGVEKAKTALKSAAIGYALAALAPLIVSILASLFGGG